MRTRSNLAKVTAVSAGLFMIGCGKAPISDQAITSDIQSKLYGDAGTRAAGIAVAVQNGAVTLSGDVPTSDVELQAMKIANGTPGVKGVTDQMKVTAAAAPSELPKAGTDAAAQPQNLAASTKPGASAATASSGANSGPSSGSQPVRGSTGPSRPALPPEPLFVSIPAGERLNVRLIDPVDSGRDRLGQVYRASLDAPLVSGNRVVVPAGSPISVVLEAVKGAGRIKGNSEVQLRVASLEYGGNRYDINSSVYEEQGKARGKQTAIRTGIGAAAGAIIGGLAGGGKGAAIGSAAGGGAGVGYNALTHGQQIKIPSEAVLNFRLEAPLRIQTRK